MLCIMTVGYAAFQTNLNINAKANVKWDEACIVGNEWTYDYKDDTIYDFFAPCSGTYKLETWGAQGGNAITFEGGYGGYSVGSIELSRREKLYIVVGGKGENSPSLKFASSDYSNIVKGGYNGGGLGVCGQCNNKNLRQAAGGGGATHIAYASGLLNLFKDNRQNLLIASGGGGGAYCVSYDEKTCKLTAPHGVGGSAGGYVANTAYWSAEEAVNSTIYATGGTQSSGGYSGYSYAGVENVVSGKFGQGGERLIEGTCYHISGAGSGYYGGGQGNFAPGAGGSSYINNSNLKEKHMTCYKCTVTNTTDSEGIKTLSTDKVSEQPLADTSKKGNGYAKITLLSHK